MIQNSISDIPEADLIEMLIKNQYWRSFLLNIKGIPDDPKISLSVPLSSIPGYQGSGDIDLLLCAKKAPCLATAIQVKRVKVKNSTFKKENPNKLKELQKGVRQTNQLVDIGFSQVCFFIFVVVDSRILNEGKVSYDGLNPTLREKINCERHIAGLDSRAGVLQYDFVQPMDHPPLVNGTVDIKLVRLATEMHQKEEITRLFADKGR